MSEIWISKSDFDGKAKHLFHALKEFEDSVNSYCGESGVCGKYQVKVTEGQGRLTTLTDSESNLLTEQELDQCK